MAKFKITFTGDGSPQELTFTAPDRDAAMEQFKNHPLDFELIDEVKCLKVADLAASNAGAPTKSEHEKGRNRVAGVVKGARARLELATRSGKIVWPNRGFPHQGIKPGKWREEGNLDETGCLPHDCPIRPLGYDGENFYFVDTMGQVFNTGGKAVGIERLQILCAGQTAFLEWAWPQFGAKKGEGPAPVTGFDTVAARTDLFAAIAKRGPWSPTDMVRGRGAWTDSVGRLVLHCGEHLIVDGELRETGEYDGQFYPRRPAIAEPWGEAVEDSGDNPAVELFDKLRTWNWVRGDVDVMLHVGWYGTALMGGAVEWRPSELIVGDAGTGKSELQKLLKSILGRMMVSTTNATEAGLYQLVGHDSLPIGIDELEGEDGQAQALKIIKMARDAASGSIRIRGGADHKGVEFTARSTFLFSAINPPPLPPASLTRLAVLQLRELESRTGQVPAFDAPDTVAPRMLRRIVDHWQDFPKLLEQYKTVLREQGGHDSRGQATFGQLLAAAHMLLGDDGMAALRLPWEDLAHWGIMLRADVAPELEGKQPNWLRCIEAILTRRPDVWRSGEQRTVGQAVESAYRDQTLFHAMADALSVADLGLVPAGLAGEGVALAIPSSSEALGKLLADTSFGSHNGAGNWTFALRQAPEGIVKQKVVLKRDGKPDNRLSIAGVQRRCVFVSMKDLKAWQEEQG